jgi:hypothetical protein
MMFKRIESWLPAHAEDMPWTRAAKSRGICSGPDLRNLHNVHVVAMMWNLHKFEASSSPIVLKAEEL